MRLSGRCDSLRLPANVIKAVTNAKDYPDGQTHTVQLKSVNL